MSTDVLKIENRLQMFCYYNTLAWQVLAATSAAAIVLVTLPFIVGPGAPNKFMYFVLNEAFAFVILGGGLYFTYRTLGYAVKWLTIRQNAKRSTND